ncbi:MAG: nucleotidyltransferase family protein, partial [Steroidobacteraceae bacterium]
SVFTRGDHTAPCSLGEHADNYLKIELHERIREALPLDTAEVSEWVFPTQPHPGLNPYPSRAALMTHLLLHAAGAMADRSLRLLHLHDLALLSSHMADRDWDEVLRQSATDHGHRWALPPLHLTARYYSRAVPTRVLAALTAECPRLLRAIVPRRTLSDVSLSRLRIEAFPGIELSRSASEMTRYIVSRVRPSDERLVLREHTARTQVAAAASQWHHLSQGRRVLRWVIARPPRAYTMLAVRMALGQAQP